MRKEDKKTIRGQPRRDHDDQSWDLWSRTVFKEATQCDVRDAIAGWTSYFIGSVLHLSCQVIYHQPGPGEILSTDLQSWPPQSLLEKEAELDSVSDDHSYLLTVEADGGDGVGVLSILESVEDGCLSAAIQTNHHTMIASAWAETH